VSAIAGQRVGFGVVFGFGLVDPGRLVADVQQAETLGFDMVSFPDHLHGERPSVEPWTALTWAAAATERIAVMPNVLALPYRAPAVTAKMAETLDRLSSGRLVLGLGTGGYDAEFAAFGLAERTPGQKVSALAEALQIMRGLWRPTAGSRHSAGWTSVNCGQCAPRYEPPPRPPGAIPTRSPAPSTLSSRSAGRVIATLRRPARARPGGRFPAAARRSRSSLSASSRPVSRSSTSCSTIRPTGSASRRRSFPWSAVRQPP